jgi:hypothetical protein
MGVIMHAQLTRHDRIIRFAQALVRTDRAAVRRTVEHDCEVDERVTEWTGESTTALADHLQCAVADLTPDDLTCAVSAYASAAEASRDD